MQSTVRDSRDQLGSRTNNAGSGRGCAAVVKVVQVQGDPKMVHVEVMQVKVVQVEVVQEQVEGDPELVRGRLAGRGVDCLS